MRLRIHHPLFAGYLVLLGLLVSGILLLAGSSVRERMVELRRAELSRVLSLASRVVETEPDLPPDSVAGLVTGRIGYRTTLIAPDGTVIGDSDVARRRLEAVENHGDRPEVRAALEGREGFASRESATVGAPLLYAARRVPRGDGSVVLRIAAPMGEVADAVAGVRRAVAWAGGVAILAALLLAYLLSRLLARPLVELAGRARSLGRGDFSRRVPRSHRIAELDDLSVAFNRLTDELRDRMADLRGERDEMQALIDTMAEGVVALTEDVRVARVNRAAHELLDLPEAAPPYAPVGTRARHPELRSLLEEAVVRPFRSREISVGGRDLLASARALDRGGAVVTFLDVSEIRRLDLVRRDFVANASHELKTPLTTIRGFSETLLEDDEPPAELRREFLETIHTNTVRLQHLVDDLLDLSRLESGGWIPRPRPLDPARLAEEVWAEAVSHAPGREVRFRVSGAGEAVADEGGLTKVLRNLFDNALRHTPDGGEVSVEVEERGTAVELTVSDTGTGIPPQALPRIFERFYRADTGRARSAGGTGLGLAIARHLVRRMGGEITAESRPGQGATFRVRLPSSAGRGVG